MKSAGMAGRRRNLGWYDAYRNRANAISATTSQSNFCFLNSIESRSLVRHRTVVGRTATPGSRGLTSTLLILRDRAPSAHRVAATALPIAEPPHRQEAWPTRFRPYV